MGVIVSVAGKIVEPISYGITEPSTPVIGGDSSGAVPTFQVTLPATEANPLILYKADVSITDSQYGTIRGRVDSNKLSQDGYTRTVSCTSTSGELAVFNVVAKPFNGTLSAALEYYIRLGHPTIAWSIPAGIGSQAVSFIGWTGELWYRLKQIAIAQSLEVVLLGDVVTFRRPRGVQIQNEHVTSSDLDVGTNDLAERAEMYWYTTSPVVNSSAYPPYRDLESPQQYSVPSGEETEITLQLSVSLSSIVQPTYRTDISPTWFEGSAICLYTDSGAQISQAEWDRGGGSVRAEIQDDPTQVKLIIRGPTFAEGGFMSGGALKLVAPAGKTHREYTTIRLRGTGVLFSKNLLSMPTGVPTSLATSETTPTDDNIFVTSANRAYDICATLSAAYSYPQVTAAFETPKPTPLGVSSGARFYDAQAGHWFRSRQNSYNRGTVGISGDIDTLHSDLSASFIGRSYQQVQDANAGLTYEQVRLKGLHSE